MALVVTEHPEFKLSRAYPYTRQYRPLDPEDREHDVTIVLDHDDELNPTLTDEQVQWLTSSLSAIKGTIDQWPYPPNLLVCSVGQLDPVYMLDGWEITPGSHTSDKILNDRYLEVEQLNQQMQSDKSGVFVLEFIHNDNLYCACIVSAVHFQGFIQHVTFAVRYLK